MTEHRHDEGCRYIHGTPKSDEPWHFCDAPQRPGSSYCEEHHSTCYQRLRKRIRAARDGIRAFPVTDILDDAAYRCW